MYISKLKCVGRPEPAARFSRIPEDFILLGDSINIEVEYLTNYKIKNKILKATCSPSNTVY